MRLVVAVGPPGLGAPVGLGPVDVLAARFIGVPGIPLVAAVGTVPISARIIVLRTRAVRVVVQAVLVVATVSVRPAAPDIRRTETVRPGTGHKGTG